MPAALIRSRFAGVRRMRLRRRLADPFAQKLRTLFGALTALSLGATEELGELLVFGALCVVDVDLQPEDIAEALLEEPDDVVVLVGGPRDTACLGVLSLKRRTRHNCLSPQFVNGLRARWTRGHISRCVYPMPEPTNWCRQAPASTVRAHAKRRRDGGTAGALPGGSCGAEPSRMVRLALLAALPTGRSLLGLRPTLCGRGAASAAPRAFSAPARGAWRVRDPRRALLTHSLLAKAFILLVGLDAGAVILCWHFKLLSVR